MSIYGFEQNYIKPIPNENPDIFVGPRKASALKIASDIKSVIKSGRPCKMIIYGVPGIGKTHLANYLMILIRDTVESLILECPSMHRRSRFVELEAVMMEQVGKVNFMKKIQNCFDGFEGRIVDVENFLGITADFAEILKKGIEEGGTLLWRYLLGQKISPAQMIALSAVKPQIDDIDATKVISITTKLFSKYENKKLLFIVDEMEKTKPLIGDSLNQYRDALRALMDPHNSTNILMLSTARGFEEFRLVDSEPIRRRIGLHNFKLFKDYEDDELIDFMKDIIQARRTKDFPLKNKIDKIKIQEKIDEKTFPFTEKALIEIRECVHYLFDNNVVEAFSPGYLLELADFCLDRAQEENLEVIDSKFVKSVEKEFSAGQQSEEI